MGEVNKNIINRGAEAVLYLSEFEGEKAVVKERIKKGYRIPEMDVPLRRKRTKREENLLIRASRAGVNVPKVWKVEDSVIIMEYIEGPTVKDSLNDLPKDRRMKIYTMIGESLANLHSANIMHGDFTTSNMILKNEKLYVIDFGLGKFSKRIEDQAVDLYLLYEALKAAHFKYLEEAWKNILKVYKHKYTNASMVIARFKEIGKRRRYK